MAQPDASPQAAKLIRFRDEKERLTGASLATGTGDGQPPGMETEIALLKHRADQTDQHLGRLESKLDQVISALASVSTKQDVKEARNAAWQALGIGAGVAVAIVAPFVGILAYLQDQRIANKPEAPAQPAQVILQMPLWPGTAGSSAPPTAPSGSPHP